jgi:predicted helicase
MQTEITKYIADINNQYRTSKATEHTYRSALELLLRNITNGLNVINEPKHITKCGAPDFIVMRGEIPLGYIETKDIGKDLNSKEYKEQFDRYKQSLDNLIITDYINFQLFQKGELVTSITIAKIHKGGIEADKEQSKAFIEFLNLFTSCDKQGIRTPEHLSKVMAAKALLMANTIKKVLSDKEKNNNNSLYERLELFRKVLMSEISYEEFSDIYAQTIAYGMFAAWLNDKTTDRFTRIKAAQLIPRSNPFLRNFFQDIAGYASEDHICWIVDDLADLFNYVDTTIKNFGKNERDPMIHFYETFLNEYDPAERKKRGVWYTPQPIVQFIVQAVDDILKRDFKLQYGLADESKVKEEFHRVQILDPATGTGTFLAEVVQNIYQRFKNEQGMWQDYVDEHLIPRINGFEILMVSHAIAHLKLNMLLQQIGYKFSGNNRLHIYLTNSLEEARAESKTPFGEWLSSEANEASHIKKDIPVMVILGNPPYKGISQNNGKWITDLIEDYKYVDGKHFKERKHWLQDDYVKFIRYGQYFVEKNGEGILAYINNHNFIDNTTFRGMRWHLLKTFDKIYILDLHGNAEKEEVCPDGSKDENVFNIKKGVSINIFVKTRHKAEGRLAEVFHYDLFGKRDEKYNFLLNNNLQSIQWQNIENKTPFFFFVPKSDDNKEEYEKGFAVKEIFNVNVTGIVTMGDEFIINEDKNMLKNRIEKLKNGDYDEQELNKKFSLGKNYSKWVLQNIPQINLDETKFVKINYRPFDIRWTYFDNNLIWRWRKNVMQHLLAGENIGLVICRQSATNSWNLVNITKNIVDDSFVSNRTKERGYVFPLYLYPEGIHAKTEKREPNLNKKIVEEISKRIGLTNLAPIDILDYIYAVLHNPTYRERYKEFLKIDFPRVPYPENTDKFQELVALGKKLRNLHLLENVEHQQGIADYPEKGSGKIEKIQYENGKVWINDKQFFDHVPREAWEFYIGSYQPAQKWLKDRKGFVLGYDERRHYQRIICALWETWKIMGEIDSMSGEYYEIS